MCVTSSSLLPEFWPSFGFLTAPRVGLTTFFWVCNRSQNAVSGSRAQVLSRAASGCPRIHDHRHRAYPFCPFPLGVWGVGVPNFLTDTVFLFLTVRVAQDTRAMASILQVIRVRIVCDNLQNAELIQ